MPDLVNPEYTNNIKQHIIWKDELCASCLNVDACPLIQTIYQHSILTHSGIHVSNCEAYGPDKESEWYVPDDASIEEIKRVNVAQLQQEMDELNKILAGIMKATGNAI